MEKEMLVLQYEALVRSELRKKNADAFPYQKIFAFFGTVLQSIFFTWCSSGDTSYFHILFQNNIKVRYTVCFLPVMGFFIYELLIYFSAKRIKENINFEREMCWRAWRERLKEFILLTNGYDADYDLLKNANEFKKSMKNDKEICFYEDDFADYLQKYYEKYRLGVYVDFYQYLAKMILLKNEMDNLIDYKEGKYIFKINNE